MFIQILSAGLCTISCQNWEMKFYSSLVFFEVMTTLRTCSSNHNRLCVQRVFHGSSLTLKLETRCRKDNRNMSCFLRNLYFVGTSVWTSSCFLVCWGTSRDLPSLWCSKNRAVGPLRLEFNLFVEILILDEFSNLMLCYWARYMGAFMSRNKVFRHNDDNTHHLPSTLPV